MAKTRADDKRNWENEGKVLAGWNWEKNVLYYINTDTIRWSEWNWAQCKCIRGVSVFIEEIRSKAYVYSKAAREKAVKIMVWCVHI